MAIYIGNNKIKEIYIGTTKISEAYIGTDKVYSTTLPFSNLSVTNDGHGSLTASVYSGYPNDTATLTPTPNTHYQFSGYTLDGGGSIANNTYTFGDTDGTAKAWFSAKHYTITTANDGHGTCTCNKTTATGNETATLGNTPATHYQFNSYQITGGSVNGNTLTVTANCTARATFKAKSYSITLQTDGHGKLTCNASTATGGQTVTLTPTNSSYYRFNNYSITGGSVNGNTLTVTANCTAKANFKVNAFTASGNFEKGSNITATTGSTNTSSTTNIGEKYAITSYHTSNVPTSWYSTSSRWKVTSTVSAYKITLNPKMTLKVAYPTNTYTTTSYYTKLTGVSLIGSTQSNSQSVTMYMKDLKNTNSSFNYSKSFTASNTGVNYGISGSIMIRNNSTYKSTATYVAANTTGTWVATGYIP